MVDVSISLVSHNQRRDLERLLPSLLVAAERVDSEILLVDNRSEDGTRELVERGFPQVGLALNPNRAGYGENHNINLRRAGGRYFVVMNSDMTVEPGVFAGLKRFMDGHPDAGIVSPRVLNEDGTIQGLNKRYPTVLDLSLRRFAPRQLGRWVQPRLDRYEMRDVGYGRVCEVPFLSGAFMFCRTDLLKALGGFDPRYFLYFEDVDLCRRVQKTHRTVYYPHVSVTHYWQRSAHSDWSYSLHFFRSALRYFSRWGVRLW